MTPTTTATTTPGTSSATGPDAATPDADAVAHFRTKLRYETDPSDVHAALSSPQPGGQPRFVLVDSRSDAAWRQGRLPGAVHLPTAQIPRRAAQLLDPRVPVVTYCWGPGCTGATRAALALAELGYQVQEMIGGFEYWAREGLPVHADSGTSRTPTDPLTGPVATLACDC